jgi:hypothetical protein
MGAHSVALVGDVENNASVRQAIEHGGSTRIGISNRFRGTHAKDQELRRRK